MLVCAAISDQVCETDQEEKMAVYRPVENIYESFMFILVNLNLNVFRNVAIKCTGESRSARKLLLSLIVKSNAFVRLVRFHFD